MEALYRKGEVSNTSNKQIAALYLATMLRCQFRRDVARITTCSCNSRATKSVLQVAGKCCAEE